MATDPRPLPYQVHLAWRGHTEFVAGTPTRVQDSSQLGGGFFYNSSNVQNDEYAWDLWFNTQTCKLVLIHLVNTNRAISSIRLDGAEVATLDQYNSAGNAYNQLAEFTGISIATTGVKRFSFKAATRHASSTGWHMVYASWAWIATTITNPTGTFDPADSAPFVEIIPWAGSATHTNFNTRDQNGVRLGMGMLDSSGAQNDLVTWKLWYDETTYKASLIYYKDSGSGIFTLSIAGTSVGTVDSYAASSSENNYSELTGLALTPAGVKDTEVKMATKHASSSNYFGRFNSLALIRTAA